jgi:hypothetical protein
VAKQALAEPAIEEPDVERADDGLLALNELSSKEKATQQAYDARVDRDLERTRRRFEARWQLALAKIDVRS